MAVYGIGKAAACYTDERGGGTYVLGGITYGRIYDGGVWYTYAAFIMFDVSGLLRTSVTNVTLKRNRVSMPSTRVNHTISAFVSKSSDTPQPLPDVYNITLLPGSINISDDYATSGTISTDITSIFNIANSVAGFIGVRLNWANPADGVAIDSDAWLEVYANPLPSYAPYGLLPTTPQNPRGNIYFHWEHNPNPNLLAPDPQTASQLEIHQPSTGAVYYPIVGGNNYVLPANTFWDYGTVYVRARTQTTYNDWGDWSSQISFALSQSSPLPPTLLFPLNISVNAESGIALEYSYNSYYDATPTRFDVRYRLNDGGTPGGWVTKINSGQLAMMTDAIFGQHTVEWQVMAYGALGDPGAWSDVGVFYSIGAPPDPVISGVSNSNRPEVTFYAANVIGWEMEFLQGSDIVYITNNQPFSGETYRVDTLFNNGSYTVRMRIANQYGLKSNWAYYNFVIDTVPPSPLSLEIPRNIDVYARLYFDNPNNMTVFVHRAEIDDKRVNQTQPIYKRIAAVNAGMYDDYTIAPGKGYVYFVRVVNPNFSFADSNKARFSVKFPYTSIAPVSDMTDMLKLSRQIDEPPSKERSHSIEKTFTQFIGRKNPVMQLGDHVSRSLTYTFYCESDERDILEEYSEANEPLIVRDRRFGTVYGQIDGEITDTPALDGTVITFSVRQMDYPDEVAL